MTDAIASTRVDWQRVILACMADYLDAGAIVAASAGLAIWTKDFGLTPTLIGLLAALGTNAASYAVGALVGGFLGDKLGRKRIYQWDLLVYVVGALLIVFAVQPWMLFAGLIVMGLAVGADVPTSWALIGEIAPDAERGRLVGLTSVFWGAGPVVVLLIALALAHTGQLGIRIVFAHLAAIAIITWLLRRRLAESEMWKRAREKGQVNAASIRRLFSHFGGRMVFVFAVHALGAIAAGSFGFFLPFILSTVGAQSQAASVGFTALNFALGSIGVYLLFMPLVDRVNRRMLYGVAGVFSVLALLLLIFLPLSNPVVVLAFVIVGALAGACGQEQFYRVWCQELFPTEVRATAQGIIIFVQKIALAVWAVFTPIIAAASFTGFAWVLTAATALSVLIGFIWMPWRPATITDVTAPSEQPEEGATHATV